MSENTRTLGAGLKLLAFVVITSVTTFALAVTIANITFTGSRTYKAIFTDATGVLSGDDVRIAGVRVGEVKSVKLYQGHLARVTFSVAKSGQFATSGLPAGVQAQIRFRNLAGQRYIALTEGPGNPEQQLAPGATIPVNQTSPALDLTVLFNGFRPLFRALAPEDVNKLSYEIVQTLQGESGTVNSLLKHVASLTNALADRDQAIGEVITNLNNVLGTIDSRTEQVGTLITNLQQFVSGLSGDRQAILDSVSSLNQLTGVTTDLLQNARPSIKNDIAGLNKLTNTLADNGGAIDTALKQAPGRLNKLANSSSYGSWFNFYLCAIDVRVGLNGVATTTPSILNDNARCK